MKITFFIRALLALAAATSPILAHVADPVLLLHNLVHATQAAPEVQKELALLIADQSAEPVLPVFQRCVELPPLFKAYPELCNSLCYISLGNFPTPITQLTLAKQSNPTLQLYCKQDGLSGGYDAQGNRLFGGNKVRKLEYLLAEALHLGYTGVMTFGCVGSNHATATAAYAHALGLDCICMLAHQYNSHIVHRNLALMHHWGARLHYYPTRFLRRYAALCAAVTSLQDTGKLPYVIPVGGSNALGVLGFVNAAFELKEQIAQGLLPEPDAIYVAAGSLGTAAGLLLGCKMAGLTSRIVAVAIEPGDASYFEDGIKNLSYQAYQLLQQLAPTCPEYTIAEGDLEVHYESTGTDYALFTNEAVAWMQVLAEQDTLQLDGTYTGKAFAGLMHDLQTKQIDNQVILF